MTSDYSDRLFSAAARQRLKSKARMHPRFHAPRTVSRSSRRHLAKFFARLRRPHWNIRDKVAMLRGYWGAVPVCRRFR